MGAMGATRLSAIVLVAVLVAGCGRASRPPPPTEREWVDNAAGFIDNLGDTLALSANGGSDLASARRALRDESDLYALVVAYTRFGGCQETLLNLGVPARRMRKVENTLTLACRRLERSSALFTQAVTGSDASALLAATQTALRASPLLYRAKAELDAVRSSSG
jgi:hypothetical protein